MQLNKILAAGSMGLLMAGSSLAFASTLGDYPAPFVTSADGVQSFIVVGATADPQDVVGAIDIAARLGGALTTEKTIATTTTAVTLSGKSEEISLDYNVSAEAGAFPTTLKNHHVPALDASIKLDWEYQADNELDAHEEFVLGFMNMSRNVAIYNGTVFLQVPDPSGTTQQAAVSAPFYYKLVFDETMVGPGNLSSTKPLSINLLGTQFDITAIPTTDKIKALTGTQLDIEFGSSGTTADGFTVTPTAYTSDNYWYINVAKGDASQEKKLLVGTSSDTEFTVGVEKVKVRVLSNITKTQLVDGVETTVKVISIAAGSTTEVVYDQTSSTTLGTATEGNNTFPGTNGHWRFEFSIATAAQFTNNDYIAVYYDPWNSDLNEESTYNGNALNLTVDQKVTLPGDYFDVQFAAMNTETFATVTIEKATPNLYYGGIGNTTAKWQQRPSIKISTTGGTFVNGTAVDKSEVYVVFNSTRPQAEYTGDVIFLATMDSSGYLRNDTEAFSMTNISGTELVNLDYGDYPNTIVAWLTNGSQTDGTGNDLFDLKITDYLGDTVLLNWTINASETSTSDMIYLGDGVSDDAASTDVVVNGTPSARIYREYYTAYGVKVDGIEGNSKSDRAVLKVPLTQLKGIVAVGKDISVGGTTSTYTDATPITTALGKLSSDIGDTEKSTKNLILVGGPCANTLVSALASNLAYQNTTLTCDNWNTLTAGGDKFGIIQVVADAWGTGKAALVVAGSTATETRDACTVLLDYESHASSLAGKSAVVVRGQTVTEIS